MAHRKIMVTISVLVMFSIVPLFHSWSGKVSSPVDDRSEFLVSHPDAGRNFAGGDHQCHGANRPRHPRDAARGGHPDYRRAAARIGPRTRFHLRQVGSQRPARANRRRNDDQDAECSRIIRPIYAPASACRAGAGRRRAIRDQRPGSRQAFAVLQQLLARLKTLPNVVDADTSLVYGKPELRVEIDRQRAADLGVRVYDIATALNTMIAGQVV